MDLGTLKCLPSSSKEFTSRTFFLVFQKGQAWCHFNISPAVAPLQRDWTRWCDCFCISEYEWAGWCVLQQRKKKIGCVFSKRPRFKKQPMLTGEFVPHRSVERMVAKMLTYVCKGKGCDISTESWTKTYLPFFAWWSWIGASLSSLDLQADFLRVEQISDRHRVPTGQCI